MDNILLVISNNDQVGPRGLAHPRAKVRRLSVVSSSSGNRDRYEYDFRSETQDSLYISHNSVNVIDDKFVGEAINKVCRPYVHHDNRVTCLT